MAFIQQEPRRDSSSSFDDKKSDTINFAEKTADPKVKQASGPLSDEDRDWLAGFDSKTQSKIYHKVDVRLVPMLAIL